MLEEVNIPDPDDDDDHACGVGIQDNSDQVTTDEDLPASEGGVA